MGEQKPESKDRLSEDIQNSVCNNLGIDVDVSGTISKTPDADTFSKVLPKLQVTNLHWVHGPEDEGEAGDSLKEGSSLGVLGLDCSTTVNGELVDDNQVGNASNGIVSPFGALVVAKSSKETGQDHDDISNDGNEDVGAAQASEEGKVQK